MSRHGFLAVAAFGVIALMLVRLPPLIARQDSVLNTYEALVEVNALTQQRYVQPITDDRLVDGAIRGMLLQLDPYSGYISPEELPAFKRKSAGEYIGIGVELGIRDGRVAVIAPVDQSPAALAGIQSGDVITSIDGEDTRDLSVLDVDERLMGAPGAPITLQVMRANTGLRKELTITRGPISLSTVRGFQRSPEGPWDYLLDPELRIAYIRISNFRKTTINELDDAIHAAGFDNLNGIILDLRSNPGGLMDQAIAMVNRFITEGLIVATVTRRGVEREYFATSNHTFTLPTLAILVNKGSASSSEIVSGSLQDHGRATIIGTRTFGKGSMQHLIELETHQAAIKLTVGVYRLPSGRVIHRSHRHTVDDNWGIMPDIELELSQSAEEKLLSVRSDLDAGKTSRDDLLQFDPQLDAALRHIRNNLPSSSAQSLTKLR